MHRQYARISQRRWVALVDIAAISPGSAQSSDLAHLHRALNALLRVVPTAVDAMGATAAVDSTCLVVAVAQVVVDRCYLVDSSSSIPPSMPTI